MVYIPSWLKILFELQIELDTVYKLGTGKEKKKKTKCDIILKDNAPLGIRSVLRSKKKKKKFGKLEDVVYELLISK